MAYTGFADNAIVGLVFGTRTEDRFNGLLKFGILGHIDERVDARVGEHKNHRQMIYNRVEIQVRELDTNSQTRVYDGVHGEAKYVGYVDVEAELDDVVTGSFHRVFSSCGCITLGVVWSGLPLEDDPYVTVSVDDDR